MTEERRNAGAFSAKVLRCNTAIVGTGAAGYNAADRLWQYGQQDILLVTERRIAGTSRNTGSDKQTYYKLTLSGGDPDSVREMAETLFSGQCVDGDIALCEAALSTQGFLKLVELGVPSPGTGTASTSATRRITIPAAGPPVWAPTPVSR